MSPGVVTLSKRVAGWEASSLTIDRSKTSLLVLFVNIFWGRDFSRKGRAALCTSEPRGTSSRETPCMQTGQLVHSLVSRGDGWALPKLGALLGASRSSQSPKNKCPSAPEGSLRPEAGGAALLQLRGPQLQVTSLSSGTAQGPLPSL